MDVQCGILDTVLVRPTQALKLLDGGKTPLYDAQQTL